MPSASSVFLCFIGGVLVGAIGCILLSDDDTDEACVQIQLVENFDQEQLISSAGQETLSYAGEGYNIDVTVQAVCTGTKCPETIHSCTLPPDGDRQ